MRRSDINLTISRYSHIHRGAAAEAVTKLPDLSTPPATEQGQATGTYDLASGETAAHLQRAGTPKEQRVSSHGTHGPQEGRTTKRKEQDGKLLTAQPLSTTCQGTPTPGDLMPKEGIEPSLCCQNGILNPARLPIPPLRQVVLSQILKRVTDGLAMPLWPKVEHNIEQFSHHVLF